MSSELPTEMGECRHCGGQGYTDHDTYIPDHGHHATARTCWACDATGTTLNDPYGLCACDDCHHQPPRQRAGSHSADDTDLTAAEQHFNHGAPA